MKIEQGQIWQVITDNFLCNKDKKWFNRHLKLNNGEHIEIRYPFAWNFRTEDNLYFHASEDIILENCQLIGVIKPDIKSDNKATLEEILRLNLYLKSLTP